jgi:hypothetical protein
MMHTRTLAALLALAAAAGCTKARTEAVVVVTTEGVRVPDDIDTIELVVADAADTANPVFQKNFRICGADITQDCLTLPLNFTLIPGAHKTHSSRVQVTATRKTMPAIANAAIFTFAEGQSLRLDFVLYANCLGNLDCAVRDQACGPDATCHPVPVTPISGEPDLAFNAPDMSGTGDDLSTPQDLSIPQDLSLPRDLATPHDLRTPNDLQMPDLAGCTPLCVVGACGPGNCGQTCTCSGTEVCQATTCNPCGNVTQACCAGNLCSGPLHCYGGTCDTPDMASGSTDMSAPADKLLTWDEQTFDTGTLYGVWAVGGDNAFAVGDQGSMGGVYKSVAGAAFAVDPAYASTTTLRAVSGSSINDVWAAGDSATIVRWNGTTWGAPPPGNPVTGTAPYNGIWVGGAAPSAHAVGGTRNGMCTDPAIDAHWNGSSWTGSTVASGGCAFGAAWGNGLGFVVWPGNEHKIQFSIDDGASVFTYQMVVTSNIYFRGVWGVTKSLFWVVGDNGTIDRVAIDKFNAGSSSAESSGVSTQLNAISGTSAGDLWAVGNSGVVLHSTGNGTWTKQTNISFAAMITLHGVFALGPNDVYAVGTLMAGGSKIILHGH